jgi:TniQ
LRNVRTTSPLPRHPHFHPTESLLGYILRLSEENGFETPSSVMRLSGVWPAKLDAPYKLTEVAKLANCDASDICKIGYSVSNKWDSPRCLLGHSVGPQDLWLKWPKVCPECIEEKGFIDAHFDLKLMIACPVHSKPLVSVCPSCDKKLQWRRPGLLKCACGAPISAGTALVQDQATIDLLDVIRRKVLHLPEACAYNSDIPAGHLAAMKARSLLFLVRLLGRIESTPRLAVPSKSSEDVVSRAAHLLSKWPANFLVELGKLTREYPTGAPILLHKGRLGGLHKAIEFGMKPRSDGAFMKALLVNFAKSRIDQDARVVQTDLANKRFDEQFLNVQQFSRKYHLQTPAVMRLIRDGHFQATSVSRNKQTRRYLDVRAIPIGPAVDEERIRSTVAASTTGLPIGVLKCLRASNDFDASHRPKWISGWYKRDVEAFALKLRDLIDQKPLERRGGGPVISLSSILRCSRLEAELQAAVIRRLLTGKIHVTACKGKNIRGVVIERDAFRECLREEIGISMVSTVEHSGTPRLRDSLKTTTETARSLRCSRISIDVLVKNGLISGSWHWGTWWITDSSICEVRERYTTVGAMAREYKVLSQVILELCRGHGISMLSLNDGLHACRRAFIKREDIPRIGKYLKMPTPCGGQKMSQCATLAS